jgi:hypothetical protein
MYEGTMEIAELRNGKQSNTSFELVDRGSPGKPSKLEPGLTDQDEDRDDNATDTENDLEETRSVGAATVVEDDEQDETLPTDNRPNTSKGPEAGEQPAIDYPTGYKLLAILAGNSIIFFAVLLDQSILSTVSNSPTNVLIGIC